MHQSATARSSTTVRALPIVLLAIVLMQASWAMYTAVTAVEVDIDHGRSFSPGDLVVGIVSFVEVIGILFFFVRRTPGFVVAVCAEALRLIIALLAKTSLDVYQISLTAISPGVLCYVYMHYDTNMSAEIVPSGPDLEPSVTRGDQAGNLDVFLSYSRRQFYFAESLMLRLERNSVSVWFDTHRIQAGADWRESIDRGISACTSLVLVASRDALASENVTYEWRTALEQGKRTYVVLFEAVDLPPELSREAVAIIDMRTRFEPKVATLVELLDQPHGRRDKVPMRNPLRLPLRQPPGILLITVVLTLILVASLFFDVLNVRTLVAITTPHENNVPEDVDIGFTTHLFGFTFHGLTSKVYAFLGITVVTLLLTALTAFLLVAVLYRRRFTLALLPLALLGSCWLYLNTSFIDHSTNHVIVDISGGFMSIPANLHSSAWRDIGDMLLGRYVDYGSSSSFDFGSPFLSIGDAGSYLTTTSAQWRWPTLLLFVLAVIAFLGVRRSASLYRWLATGVAPEKLRFEHNKGPDTRRRTRHVRAALIADPPRWRLLHHPADSHLATEIETALAEHVPAGDSEPRDVAIVLLTNHTKLDWLEDLERENVDLICVVCTNIQLVETLKLLRRHQWFDYRERSYDKLALLARSLQKVPSTSRGYSFPALPERLTRMVLPGPVRYKSHAMRLCATWLLAVTLFGEGRTYSGFIQDEGLGRLVPGLITLMFLICIPCCVYLFWLAIELASSQTTYALFQQRLNIVMTALFVTQLQFLLAFDDQFGLVLLGALINVFLAIAWLTPDTAQIQRWLPAGQSGATGTLAVPLRHQFTHSSMIYAALFVFCYWSGAIFFADAR